FRIMDRYERYVQVLTLANPPLEVIGGPDVTPDLARLANDEMAALVSKHRDRFPAFVASLPMNNPDAALKEIDRAIGDLGATGVQMFSNVNRRPLDLPEFQPLFDRMAERRLPIWLHPARPALVADSAGEPRSQFAAGWAFGWPFGGALHILFGTARPFDPERGPGFVRDTIAAMERMRASAEDKAAIYEGNARRLLKLRLPAGR